MAPEFKPVMYKRFLGNRHLSPKGSIDHPRREQASARLAVAKKKRSAKPKY